MSQVTINTDGPVHVTHIPFSSFVISKEGNIWKVVRKAVKEDHNQGGKWTVTATICELHEVDGGVVEMGMNGKPKRVWMSVFHFITKLRLINPDVEIIQS